MAILFAVGAVSRVGGVPMMRARFPIVSWSTADWAAWLEVAVLLQVTKAPTGGALPRLRKAFSHFYLFEAHSNFFWEFSALKCDACTSESGVMSGGFLEDLYVGYWEAVAF